MKQIKQGPPLLKAYVVNEKCHYRLKNFAVNRAYREVSPVMTSIKYTNGTFSTILNMAFSVLYTQSKWFDHRA